MFDSFIRIQECILELMRERADLAGYRLTEYDFEQMKSLRDGLKPMEDLILHLCRENINLYTSEKLHKKVLKKLKKQNTTFSNKLHNALKKRYLERRHHEDQTHNNKAASVKDVVSLITFLQDPEEYKNYSDPDFPLTSETQLKQVGKRLMEQLFFGEVEAVEENPAPVNLSDEDSDSDCDLSKVVAASSPSKKVLSATKERELQGIAKEVTFLKATSMRTENLDRLLKALLNISPTSVPSERAFSVAGVFMSKRRGSMSATTLNNLCFLKSYFNSKQK